MQAAKDYSDNHTEIPYFVIAGAILTSSDSFDLEDRENRKILIKSPVRTGYLPLPTGFLY